MKIRIEQIREVREADAALLRWLQLATLPGDVPIPTDEGHWWVAYQDGSPVGYAGVKRSTRWLDAMYLCRAGVLALARGQGLQKRLIRVREAKAKALGMRWLVTDTFQNPASANSLISCGFKMFTPSTPWASEGACYWKKELKQ